MTPRNTMTLAQCARAVRDVYDSLRVRHDPLQGYLHDGWAVCPCPIAEVIRAQAKALSASADWMSGKQAGAKR